MKLKNKLIGLLGAFVMVFCIALNVVGAVTTVQENMLVAEFNNPANIDINFLRHLDDAIYLNSSVESAGVTKSNSFWVLAEDTGTYYLQVCLLSPYLRSGTYTFPKKRSSTVSFSSVDFISSYSFTFSNAVTNSHAGGTTTVTNQFYMDGTSYIIGSYSYNGSSSGSVTYSNFIPRYTDIVCVRNYTFPFDPILTPILDYPYDLNIQKQAFVEWLISTGRYTEINSAMLSNHVSQYVDLFNEYGASLTFFKKQISAFFSYHNIGQGISDYNVILNKTRQLYQEFLRQKNDTVGNHLAPRVESSIVPETNDNNTVLVTNAVDDTTIISLLRDILRSLIALPSTLNDLTQLILNKLDSLDLTTNIVNDGGAGITDFSDLYIYDSDAFSDDLEQFQADIEEVQSVPVGYISSINDNTLMPEKMLSDKSSLVVNVPTIAGFTVSNNGSAYTTQTTTYVLRSVDYPWLDTAVQKIKRFASILLIIGYLVHLRYRIPELIRGE